MKSRNKMIIGALVGAIGGYAYYYFIGCKSGSCPITGNPWISTVYGLVLGLTLTYSSKRRVKKAGD